MSIEGTSVDGVPVAIATVHECDPSAKPCEVNATETSCLRLYDGGFPLSGLEEQAFLAFEAWLPHHVWQHSCSPKPAVGCGCRQRSA